MIEGIAMFTILAGMGFYFVKSADLPKDLKDRSAQLKNESQNFVAPERNKFAHLSAGAKLAEAKKTEVTVDLTAQLKREASLLEMRELAQKAALEKASLEESLKAQKLAKIELLNNEIDELTLAITVLEQELSLNTKRNTEIEAQIIAHLARLQTLKETKIS